MIVLGISPLDKDSTVSLLADGKVLFAAAEERYSRQKLQDGFPAKALRAALDYTGVRIEDIDTVAYAFFDCQKETELFTKNVHDEKEFLDKLPPSRINKYISACIPRVPTRAQPISRSKPSKREDA